MLQHGKNKLQLQLKKKVLPTHAKTQEEYFENRRIIDSKPRSPSSYTFSRDNCDAEVIGIITLKAHGSSFQFISRKTCLEHQAAACEKQESKKQGKSTHIHSSPLYHNSPNEKKEGTCVPPCCHSCSSSQRPVLKQVHLEH
ncbi:hypothetical protein AVEN_81364-1 [Araneus ventricosus]|uniref:Uncharacterized protein n=1 Tax=Araneus ventricosus TaxID=182803 RepID=A0A4Y2B608_ARAVE|nr:hypothetical protein AVEN_81364-1 [Araneus ventricosus]